MDLGDPYKESTGIPEEVLPHQPGEKGEGGVGCVPGGQASHHGGHHKGLGEDSSYHSPPADMDPGCPHIDSASFPEEVIRHSHPFTQCEVWTWKGGEIPHQDSAHAPEEFPPIGQE